MAIGPTAQANHEIRNWAGSIRSYPRRLVRALDFQTVQRVVLDDAEYPSPVRAVGSNHSTTECGVADGGTLIEMSAIDHIHIDRDAMTVTAGAGALYIDVAEKVSAAGLQLAVNPEIGNVSVGSACCGGTKDASMPGEMPQVCSYCISMKIVGANGKIETITEQSDPGRLFVLRSSYGLMGVVLEATFQLTELRPIRFRHKVMSTKEFSENFDAINMVSQSMMLYVLPFLGKVVIELREESDRYSVSRCDWWKWQIRNRVWKTAAPAIGRTITRFCRWKWLRYKLIDAFNYGVVLFLENVAMGRATDPKDQVIRYPDTGGIGTYTFSIWAFPTHGFAKTFEDYVDFCRGYYAEHGYRCNMLNVGYRFAKDDKSLLAYSADGERWSLDVVSTGDEGWDQFVWSYNAFCSDRGGKPLFNQTRSITPSQVKAAFGPLIDRFERERQASDPKDRFLNEYFSWVLSEAHP